MEKRLFNRVVFTAPALLIQQNKQWQTDVLDVSLKGALIAYPDEFEADLEDVFELNISMMDDQQNVVMHGSIVHSANHCLGFQISDVDLDSMTELRRIVELNLGDEDLIHRDLKALAQS
ncbi:PilZ domain-containing protein [Aliiglaciecola sp.]|nr:PilZ domain-containing protein [Aliiglaciecola sp.]